MNNSSSVEKNRTREGVLYLVATPIGNLSDISERALKVLAEVDFIAAEDTRNSGRLLAHFGIKRPLVSYYEHNKAEKGPQIVNRLLGGESCALVTDAGTPAVSDPGEDLVRLCIESGVPVCSIPGACAAITALTLSGLSTTKFCFEGFLPVARTQRREALELIRNEWRTMIFYEAPHKLLTTLKDLRDCFGEQRRLSLCRELTKLNEEVLHLTLGAAVEFYSSHEPRGEYVLVIEGGTPARPDNGEEMTVPERYEYYIAKGLSGNDAIKAIAKERGCAKNIIYQQILQYKGQA